MKKTVSVLLAVLMLCTMALPSFAAESPVQAEIDNLVGWLSVPANSKINYEDTSKVYGAADWIALDFARAGVEVPKEYAPYLEAALPNATLYPSDMARVYLGAAAAGMDVQNIGGVDLVKALSEVSYKDQTYMSSLIFPLLAMDYNKEISFPDAKRQEIIDTILAAQKPMGEEFGGAFNWDTNPANSVDTDTTAMVICALAPYRAENPQVQTAIDNALSYIKSVKADNGGYGHPQWGVSPECTAQVVIALCTLGIDPTCEEYSNNGKTPIDALKSYMLESGAGAYGSANAMTTEQTLRGFVAYDRFLKGETAFYDGNKAMNPEQPTETPSETPSETQPEAQPQTEAPAENPTTSTEVPEIPKTGFGKSVAPVLMTAAFFGAAALVMKKKHD